MAIAETGKGKASGKSKGASRRRKGLDQRLVKSLAHELRVEILGILNERMASPNELSKELDEGLSQVSYHVKVLREYDCIEMVKTEPRRGAVEHYYQASSRAFLTGRDWHELPDSVRPGLSADLFELIRADVVRAMLEGTFDARNDRHMSRTPFVVDSKGWDEITACMTSALKEVEKIKKQSATRLARSGEEGAPVAVSMLGFELPEPPSLREKSKKKAKGSSGARGKGKAKAKGRAG